MLTKPPFSPAARPINAAKRGYSTYSTTYGVQRGSHRWGGRECTDLFIQSCRPEREGPRLFRSPIASCRDEWWENIIVHLSFEKCEKSNRARQHLSRFTRKDSRGVSPVFEKEYKRSPGFWFWGNRANAVSDKKKSTQERSAEVFFLTPETNEKYTHLEFGEC